MSSGLSKRGFVLQKSSFMLLFSLLVCLPGVAGQKYINDKIDQMDLSPLQRQRRLRFALVDVPIHFSYVSSLMDPTTVKGVETVCEVFLDQGLGVEPSTTIFDIHVMVLSQSITPPIKLSVDDNNMTAMTDTLQNSTLAYAITTRMEIHVQYELAVEDPGLNAMDSRIKLLFSTQWQFLLDLLFILDENYFGDVSFIALGDEDEVSFFDRFDTEDDAIDIESAPNANMVYWGSFWAIIAFVVAGVTLLISVLTLYPLVRRICLRKTAGHQSTNSSKPTVSDSSTSNANTYDDHMVLKEFGIVTDEEMSEVLSSTYQEESHASPVTPAGKIQAIFSEDKIHNPMSLYGLREKRESAAEKVKFRFNEIQKCSNGGNDIASIADSCPDDSSMNNGVSFVKLLKKQDIESQLEALRRKRQMIEDRIKIKHDKLSSLDPPGAACHVKEVAGLSAKEGCWIQSGDMHRKDGDSVSTITGAIFNDEEDEDEAFEVLSREDSIQDRKEMVNRADPRTRTKHLYPGGAPSYHLPPRPEEFF